MAGSPISLALLDRPPVANSDGEYRLCVDHQHTAQTVTTNPTNFVNQTSISANDRYASSTASTSDVISHGAQSETQSRTSRSDAPAATASPGVTANRTDGTAIYPTHLITNGAPEIEELSESRSSTTTEHSIIITEVTTQAFTKVTTVLSQVKDSFDVGGKHHHIFSSMAGRLAEFLWSFVLKDVWPIMEAQITEQMKIITSTITTSTTEKTQEKYEKRFRELKSKYEDENAGIKLKATKAIRSIWAEHKRRITGDEKAS